MAEAFGCMGMGACMDGIDSMDGKVDWPDWTAPWEGPPRKFMWFTTEGVTWLM